MKREYIAEGWERFAEAVFHETGITPDSVQYTEMRRAFYAGAISVLKSLMNATDDMTDDEDFNVLADTIDDELKNWMSRVERGEV